MLVYKLFSSAFCSFTKVLCGALTWRWQLHLRISTEVCMPALILATAATIIAPSLSRVRGRRSETSDPWCNIRGRSQATERAGTRPSHPHENVLRSQVPTLSLTDFFKEKRHINKDSSSFRSLLSALPLHSLLLIRGLKNFAQKNVRYPSTQRTLLHIWSSTDITFRRLCACVCVHALLTKDAEMWRTTSE